MNYIEAESYLYDLCLFGTKLGLNNIRCLLEVLGNPQSAYPIIHVAGTNGKGSVCALLQSLFTASGLKTGLYTSPHLISLRERLKIGVSVISTRDFISVLQKVKKAVEKLNGEGLNPTFFEVVTAMAFVYFQRKKVDVVVLETGLGGTFDATNVVASIVSIITNVELDHCKLLGDTFEKIAEDKAGIIKPRSVFLSAEPKPSVQSIFRRICAERNAEFIAVTPDSLTIRRRTPKYADCDFVSQSGSIDGIRTNLIASYQRQNIPLALEAYVRAMAVLCPDLPFDRIAGHIKRGMRHVRLQGRFHRINKFPPVIADAAHNPAGIRECISAVHREFPCYRICLVFGILADKEYEKVAEIIAPEAEEITCVKPLSKRALPAEHLAECCRKFARCGVMVEAARDWKPAVDAFITDNLDKTVLLICGSFYLLGDVLKRMGKTRLRVMDREADYR
ncbi:MAG: bifunctional folylpolyglutamate synthase/dihydrofolate synthase [Candidatus Auribacter fodinae]|jgi:dihydrofolate synthase/folylpolyglutamate synthase|uniref:Dihydrofolate synthase/folylpolyglutamate synthase n=1 Tax=Candidatus Auribacter fodinae TaxID=2093366 RepID=A0A3A4R420_9BACT|nr:MAG: bifunctional folylpolyglutamate synthase/dihydrofolate synthase [Candidatus Auribacter fodinae]